MCECGSAYHEGDKVRLTGPIVGAEVQAVADKKGMEPFEVTGYSPDDGVVEVMGNAEGKVMVVVLHQDEVVRLDSNDD